MIMHRRAALGLVGMVAAAPSFAARVFGDPGPARIVFAPAATPAFRAAAQAIAAEGAAELAAWGFPGMTIAIRAADGQEATAALGDARPGALYQIGSISKSICAIALLRLADAKRIDLDAPVRAATPDLPIEDARVTFAHIFDHSAGLPGNAPPFARVPGDRLWSATAPGTRFSYSNSGYDMLGQVVERASGMPFDRAIRTLVLNPIGMRRAEPIIRTADRARYATGYGAFRTDTVWMPHDLLTEGSWLDIDRAAGSVAATSSDMLRYIAFVGACARGDGGGVLSAAAARRLTTATIAAPEFGPKARYGMGLATVPLEHGPALHHTGGMIVFHSSVTIDPASGAGVFASVNCGAANYRPRGVTWHGVEVLRALAAGRTLPAAPAVVPIAPVADADDYAGRFVGPDGSALTLERSGAGLFLLADGARGRLMAVGENRLVGDHATRGARALEFEGAKGRRDRVWVGGALFGRDSAVPQPAVPERLVALAGTYRSNDPWVGGTDVFARGETLVIEGAGALTPAADGSWRFADPDALTERVWFEAMSGGRARRLSLSGEPLIRAVG